MNRIIGALLVGLGVAGAALAIAVASALSAAAGLRAQAGGEQILRYDVAVAIQRDASILVTERIVYDFGGQARHGIIRGIPVQYPYSASYDRITPLTVRSAGSPDAPAQYTMDNTGGTVTIKIGDPDRTVTGVHTYTLTYLVRGVMNAFADHDELYWNATGNGWDVPIAAATVRVTAPGAPQKAACWAGPPGAARSCQQARITDGDATFTQAGLGPHEGLTVVVALPKGVVAAPHPVLQEKRGLQQAFAFTPVSAGVSGGLLVLLAGLGALVVARGRRRERGTPAARHEEPPMEAMPPEDLRPGQAGTLLDGVANPQDVTATIADLAVRGYVRIEETGDPSSPDWLLVRLGKTGGLLDYEQILLDGLFAAPTTTASGEQATSLSELDSHFTEQLKQCKKALYQDVTARGWFTTRPDRARRKWITIGIALLAAGAVGAAALAGARLGLVPVPLALAGLALIIWARRIPVRTAAGAAMTRQVEGFRRYVATAAVVQAPGPDGRIGALYDYLPYAIAFGCTKEWADLTAAMTGAAEPPSWLRTGPQYRAGVASLQRSGFYFLAMHQFAAAANKSVSSVSASGQSSFSGGGGFSGGGFGGGGGGSW
jgi:uncharacterized membrane protein YgcG